jgi:[ribosomal protein S5]-alanine N-acetyltransferase
MSRRHSQSLYAFPAGELSRAAIAVDSIPTLTTPRLILRPFVIEDGPAVERLAGAREVADTTLNIPHPYPEGGGAAWIESQATTLAAGKGFTLAITLRETQALLGAIGLAIDSDHSRGELGYWITVADWGRGYATESARAIMTFGFGVLGLHRIQARHFTRNPSSGRVMEKLGMRFEGINRDAYFRWGRFEDVAVYGILSDEWKD